jgi:hypothetical protein
MKKLITILIVLVVLLAIFVFIRDEATAPGESPSVNPSPSLSSTPSRTPVASSTPVSQANIIVTSPKPGAQVGNSITVTGKARVFEGHLSYRLKDDTGKVVYESFAQIGGPQGSQHQPFSITIPVPLGTSQNVTIEVFEYSAKDGSVINLVSVPVKVVSK